MPHPLGNGVRVSAPARLHLGFLDLHGGLGRKFGSIGLTLEWPRTVVEAVPAPRLCYQGPISHRAQRITERFYTALSEQRLQANHAVHLTIKEAIPDHSGLGSGTQLALAIGRAISQVNHLPLSIPEIAALLDRGKRSGIGIGSFLKGGFLVDGGLKPKGRIPPIICRHDFPEQWWVLLIIEPTLQGLHGTAETKAFHSLPPFPAEQAAVLCRLTMMQALPALVERDIQAFGQALNAIQAAIGDYFAPAQGARFASPWIAAALQQAQQWGVPAMGQSSWGPTGFALVEGETAVRNLQARLIQWAKEALQGGPKLQFIITRARNQGGRVESLVDSKK